MLLRFFYCQNMKETFYFSHDYNTRTDAKIKRLILKHGYLGYGLFWAIIEDLYQNANALQTDYEGIAYDLRTTEIIVKSIINDFDLFVLDNGCFGSLSVQRRLDERNAKSLKARESASKRWNKCDSNANALQTQSDSNAIKESKVKDNKVKESKVKDNKVKESKEEENIHAMRLYVSQNLPNVSKMKTQLTNENCVELIERFGSKLLNEKLLAMENTAQIAKKNLSVYLTLINWCSKDVKKITQQTPQQTQLPIVSPPSPYKKHE